MSTRNRRGGRQRGALRGRVSEKTCHTGSYKR